MKKRDTKETKSYTKEEMHDTSRTIYGVTRWSGELIFQSLAPTADLSKHIVTKAELVTFPKLEKALGFKLRKFKLIEI